MKKEIRIFLTALMFYTRIPCPSWKDHNPDDLNRATRYFPLVGWIVGGISFAVYAIGKIFFGDQVAIVFSLIAGVLTTGAFHEDGLSDTFDGFGGGWTVGRILEIMKDSRVGAYGVVALCLMFLLKFSGLVEMLGQGTISLWREGVLFISYHSLARCTGMSVSFVSPYAREDATSKIKPIAKSYTWREVLGCFFFGLFPLCILCFFNLKYLFCVLPLCVLVYFSRRYFTRWIGGYTGDCLGAVEQLAELVCILSFVMVWRFS